MRIKGKCHRPCIFSQSINQSIDRPEAQSNNLSCLFLLILHGTFLVFLAIQLMGFLCFLIGFELDPEFAMDLDNLFGSSSYLSPFEMDSGLDSAFNGSFFEESPELAELNRFNAGLSLDQPMDCDGWCRLFWAAAEIVSRSCSIGSSS